MREHKYKTTVIEDGEEIELIVDMSDTDELYSNLGRYGSELTKDMRQFTGYVCEVTGEEVYVGDFVKCEHDNILGIPWQVANLTGATMIVWNGLNTSHNMDDLDHVELVNATKSTVKEAKVDKIKHRYVHKPYYPRSIACTFNAGGIVRKLGVCLTDVDATYSNLRKLVRLKHIAIRKVTND